MATQQILNGCESLAKRPGIEEILALAVEKSAGADAIEKLVRLQQELLQREAEREFNEAMNKCQSEIRLVRNDKDNKQTQSRYATYAALDKAIRPVYTKYGISVSYSTIDCPIPDHIRMVAYVSLGSYTRPYQTDEACDGKGAKGADLMTKAHAKGSAHMYGKRNLLKDIFNLVTGDEVDDDGNGADGGLDISEELEFMANAKDLPELQRLYTLYYKQAMSAKDQQAMRSLMNAKNKRKAELL